MPRFDGYYQALGAALDDVEFAAVTAGTTTSFTAATLVNTLTGVTSARYEGRWAYHSAGVNAPQQRKISAYDPATGACTVTPAWTTPAGVDQVVLTSLFPILHVVGSETEYREIINRALGRMYGRGEATVSVPAGAQSVSLAALPWLDRPERLLGVREPSPIGGREPIDSSWRKWELVPGLPTSRLRLRTPFLGAATVTLDVLRPASSWIAVGGVWGESTVGLHNESDQAMPSIEEFLPFGLVEALGILIARAPGRPSAEWVRLLKDAQDAVSRSRYKDRTQEVAQPAPAVATVQGAA